MNDSSTQLTQLQFEFPEAKLCECGCGLPAPIATYHAPKRGYIKGQPVRFIHGHNGRECLLEPKPNPTGLCMCGCGQPAPIAKRTRNDLGQTKGEPVRFIRGHTAHLREIRPDRERFWDQVDKSGGPDACWIWMGTKNHKGYGRMRIAGRDTFIHRYSWELHNGTIPEDTETYHGICVLHRCDNPACVRPDHLFLGTNQDNIDDKVAKGRQHRGETHHRAKLTDDDVRDIRRRAANGDCRRDIERDYAISKRTLNRIIHRESWRHI